ncbi:MAG: NUDIX domain-containing protein [archaeon]
MKSHNKIAGIIIRDKRLLMVRKYGEPHFIMPGGQLKSGETIRKALERELEEELDVKLISMDNRPYGVWEAPHFQDQDKIVRMETYFVEIEGNPVKTSEIDEIRWVSSSYAQEGIVVASINQDCLIPKLLKDSFII